MQLIDDHLHTRMMTIPSHHCGHFLSHHHYRHRSHCDRRNTHQHQRGSKQKIPIIILISDTETVTLSTLMGQMVIKMAANDKTMKTNEDND